MERERLLHTENKTRQIKGIIGNPLLYMRMPDGEYNTKQAYQDINKALEDAFDINNQDSIGSQLINRLGFKENTTVSFDFINYGNDQLIYTATMSDGYNSETVIASVNQPRRSLGEAGIEYKNLQHLASLDPEHVVTPLAYSQNGKQEIVITPYIHNARCIFGGYKEWGVFDPEPIYHFIPFDSAGSELATTNMIALLVHFYDKEKGIGLADTHLSGDDFIISQDWNPNYPKLMLNHMKLISARKMIHITFDKYLDLIRYEFGFGTHYRQQNNSQSFLINRKSEQPMSKEVIEKGIELGLNL